MAVGLAAARYPAFGAGRTASVEQARVVSCMPMDTDTRTTLTQIYHACTAQATPVWLVGGAARDLARGALPADLDLAVPCDGVELARELANLLGGAFVLLDAERGVGRVVLRLGSDPPALTIDVVQLRAATLEADLRLRDFTINALALPLARVLASPPLTPADFIDPCGGLADLAARTLRPCYPASLSDDPLRMLRAFRLGAWLDLHMSPELHHAIQMTAPQISTVAAERVRDELLRLLEYPACGPHLITMDQLGLLTQIFPELEPSRHCDQPIIHFLPVLAHTLEAVVCFEWLLAGLTEPSLRVPQLPVAVQHYPDLPRQFELAAQLQQHFAAPVQGGPRGALVKLALLLHDNAKPQTKQPKPGGGVTFYGHQGIGAEVAAQIARRLKLSRSATALVVGIVREHMRPGQLRDAEGASARAYARFYRDAGEATPDILLHALADHMAVRGPMISPPDWEYHLAWTNTRLREYLLPPPERTQPIITGRILMRELGLVQGALIGELLRELHEAQAAGEISTTAEALALARTRLQEREP